MKPSNLLRRRFARPCFPLFAGILACSDATAPVAPCRGAIDVGVEMSPSSPRFTWSPRCGISSLRVATVPVNAGDVETTVWSFTVPESSPIGPDIRYGVLPATAVTGRASPDPLVPGVRYVVRVMQTVGEDAAVAMGSTSFTVPVSLRE